MNKSPSTRDRLTNLFGLIIGLAFAMIAPNAHAHGVAGQRFFPTTFAVDDPFISDEFSVLYHQLKMNSDQAGGPQVDTSSLSVGYSKRILPNFGLEFDSQYQRLHTEGDGTMSGFGNLGVNAKYQFYTSAEHETILSVGIADEIGNTGNHNVSDSFSTITPAFFFGKGFGDLFEPSSLLRPLAVTGVIGANVPTQASATDMTGTVTKNPTTLTWAFTLQYSLMYLQSAVKDVGLGAPFNRLVAIVEFPMETCLNADCKHQTSGTVNPGIAWIGKQTELGIAAEIPRNPRSGAGTGVCVLFHLFVDDLFPNSIGRPIFP